MIALTSADGEWSARIAERLREASPRALKAVGPVGLLAERKTAFLCSARAPGDVLLRAHDAARRLRDEGVTVISGFQSPIEKDCLHILVRGKQPIIVCVARSLEGMRIPTECRPAFEAGRLLFISPFGTSPRRVTRDSANRRNLIVAALADEAFIPHATPGGQTARIEDLLKQWGVPVRHK